MSRRYSAPAIDPRPKVLFRMAARSFRARLALKRALTKYRMTPGIVALERTLRVALLLMLAGLMSEVAGWAIVAFAVMLFAGERAVLAHHRVRFTVVSANRITVGDVAMSRHLLHALVERLLIFRAIRPQRVAFAIVNELFMNGLRAPHTITLVVRAQAAEIDFFPRLLRSQRYTAKCKQSESHLGPQFLSEGMMLNGPRLFRS